MHRIRSVERVARLLLVPSERLSRLAGDDRFHGEQQRAG